MKHIIFDYDGVLIDSFEFHLKKVNEFAGIGLTAQEYSDAHDGNFYANKIEKLENVDFSEYAKWVSQDQGQQPLNDDAKNLLVTLAENNKLHLITSAWKTQAYPFLENHGITTLFTTLQFAEDSASKHDKFVKLFEKEDINPDETIFITDTLGDLIEAHNFDIQTIAVTFGFHDKEHLLKGSPTYVANSWKEVENVLNTTN